MKKFDPFFLVYGLANAGLTLHGLLALITPGILMESFSLHVYQFPSDARVAVEYLVALYRLLGFLNLLLGGTGLWLLSRYRSDRQPWLLFGLM